MKKLILLSAVFLSFSCSGISFAQNIFVNQLGYYPTDKKYALIEEAPNGSNSAQVIDTNTNSTILQIPLGPALYDVFSKQKVNRVDFSSITTPGKYYIQFNNTKSYDFEISSNIYNNALYQTARSYHLQSCGKAINDHISGMMHPACHLQDGHIKRGDKFNATDKIIDSKGGWHDAGDYGKYIASTSTTTALLMAAFEMNPDILSLALNTPPDDSNIPDFLKEIKYALSWMLKQQRADGAVYRKTSGEKWPSDTTLPQNDTQKRFVYGISSQDTGRFAATMAMAARIYKKYDPSFADKCLKASQLAWEYLNTHNYYTDYQSTDDSGSGGYPNPSYDTEPYAYKDIDDKIWSATELYLATKDPRYLTVVNNNIDKIPYEPFSWKNTTYMAVLEIASKDICDQALKSKMKQKLLKDANDIISKMANNPYSMPMDKFKWGSNANVLGECINLAYAYNLTKDPRYKEYATRSLNYIFGCNPMNKSYVTGLGDNPAKNIHYRYTMATGTVLPGFMVGGPNNTANDNVAKPGLSIKSYIDNAHSYATNEYAIDYNAPLVFMLGWAIANN